ncbi:protein kinase [Candidatus Uabimicrobium sp. HlEnr_7]|uniref:protein kinase domain-containing protein n=1 Tax=Candidatus Uabimicrobium helgolandensis TaxID=3095367 RepID=UPI0035563130
MEIEKYQPLELLRSWQGGVCYRAYNNENNNIIDLRIFKHGYFSKEKWQQISKKLLRLYALNHPRALKILDMDLINSPRFVAFEFLQKIPLRQFNFPNWDTLEKMQFIEQIVSLITEAHRLGIAHNNLSIDTVYVADNNIKIDFAYSAELHTQQSSSSFLALGNDTYCVAKVIYWILTNGEKYKGNINIDVEKSTKYFAASPFNEFIELLKKCFHSNTRVQMSELKYKLHEFIITTSKATQEMQKENTVLIENAIFGDKPQNIDRLKKIGRFIIEKKIGSGGMGVVYLAKDKTDQSSVALKIISPKCAEDKNYLQRFYKEARLLSEVNNPYVANMLEINQEKNLHYLVMEFIAGDNISSVLKKHKQLSEKQALFIIADVVRALNIAHKKQVIHRDIKPANIILTTNDALKIIQSSSPISIANQTFAKLSDFGLARHVVENESLDLTQSGAILGTPKYMSPEQCQGKKVSAQSDLYSVGITLFSLIAGCPPFDADTPFAIINKHVNTPAPSVKEYAPNASENICSIIEKLLRKDPNERYQSAGDLLSDIESLLRGEPTNLIIHPQLPSISEPNLLNFEFKWQLKSTIKDLWPHVTNTEKVNKALGLVAPDYSYVNNPQNGRQLFARNKSKLFSLEWQEHPYEWLHEKRMSILREYNYGIFKWMASIVEFHSHGEGTQITHKFVISPRNWFARILLNYQFNKSVRSKLNGIYQKMDNYCQRKTTKKSVFIEENKLSFDKKILLQRLIQKSSNHTIDKKTQQTFELFIEKSSDQDVARIRPLALSKQLNIDPQQLITLCLNAAAQGLLTLLWDVICPLCRIPSDLKDTLREIKNHGYCEACNIDYELDFANSVELIFKVHSSVRESDLQIYCVGGPAHSPHVISQMKLQAKECLELNLKLNEGAYLLRSPQLQHSCKFQISKNCNIHKHNLQISSLDKEEFTLTTEKQCIQLINDFDKEIVLRIEHTVSRRDTLTAAYVSTLPLFRKLFPLEVLSPQQLVSISNLILIAVDIHNSELFYKEKTDSQAFQLLYNYLQNLEQHITENTGVVIKTKNEGLIASFPTVKNAIQAAISLQKKLESCNCNLKTRVTAHRGPAMVATINNRLDYFGSTIKSLEYMLSICNTDQVIYSQSIAEDPTFTKLLNQYQLRQTVHNTKIPRTQEYIIETACL